MAAAAKKPSAKKPAKKAASSKAPGALSLCIYSKRVFYAELFHVYLRNVEHVTIVCSFHLCWLYDLKVAKYIASFGRLFLVPHFQKLLVL